jgi:hypothetical protein
VVSSALDYAFVAIWTNPIAIWTHRLWTDPFAIWTEPFAIWTNLLAIWTAIYGPLLSRYEPPLTTLDYYYTLKKGFHYREPDLGPRGGYYSLMQTNHRWLDEVARAVGPLRERLLSERSKREEAEAQLRKIRTPSAA